jgi:hypothetical protein
MCEEYGLPPPDWAGPEAAELAREELGLPRLNPRKRGSHADYHRRLSERNYQIAAFTAVALARIKGYRDFLTYEYALKALHRDGFGKIYTSEESLQKIFLRVQKWDGGPWESKIETCVRWLQIEFDNIRAEEEAERRRRE